VQRAGHVCSNSERKHVVHNKIKPNIHLLSLYAVWLGVPATLDIVISPTVSCATAPRPRRLLALEQLSLAAVRFLRVAAVQFLWRYRASTPPVRATARCCGSLSARGRGSLFLTLPRLASTPPFACSRTTARGRGSLSARGRGSLFHALPRLDPAGCSLEQLRLAASCLTAVAQWNCALYAGHYSVQLNFAMITCYALEMPVLQHLLLV
jgi:hypothetical protein